MKVLVAAFNQEKALVGAFSVIVQLHRLIVHSGSPYTPPPLLRAPHGPCMLSFHFMEHGMGCWSWSSLMLYEGDCSVFSVVQRQEETQTLFDEDGLC